MSLRSALRMMTHALARRSAAFDLLRWILEAGHRGEKTVLARELVSRSIRLLDVGSGTGTMASEFCPEGYLGVDIHPHYVARARRKLPNHRFLVMDARSLGLAGRSFDLVLISGVLHHIDETSAQRVLMEVRRVLRPGGRLLVWEDVPTARRFNVLGRLVQWLDEGDDIRLESGYRRMLEPLFAVERSYRMQSGVCDYAVFACRNRERPS